MKRARRTASSLASLAALTMIVATAASAPHASGQMLRIGTEFQVNSFTNAKQYFVSAAADADGDFVVAWESDGQDGSGGGVFARRFSSVGAPLGAEFQVNTVTAVRQGYPAVAIEANGDFVVVWQSNYQDSSSRGVFARRFSSTGVALAIEFQVTTFTDNGQSAPAVASDSDGDFLVAWSSNQQDGDGYGVFARRFSSAGVAQASEFQVDEHTAGTQRFPRVATSAGGSFVIAWQSTDHDGSSYGILARRFSSTGAPLGAEVQANTYATAAQRDATVASSESGGAGGSFVVAWTDDGGQDGSFYGIFARRFSSSGTALAGEFQVSNYTPNSQRNASAAMSPSGDFLVAWTSFPDGSAAIAARRFSSAGAALTEELRVNTYTLFDRRLASIGASGDGRFVVAWQAGEQDGSDYGIFGQRLAPLILLDIDGNGSVQALTDGLLVLRYGFGFRGATLITGAVGPGCTRCDAASIEAYLAAHID